jgi:hypothetical protein
MHGMLPVRHSEGLKRIAVPRAELFAVGGCLPGSARQMRVAAAHSTSKDRSRTGPIASSSDVYGSVPEMEKSDCLALPISQCSISAPGRGRRAPHRGPRRAGRHGHRLRGGRTERPS